MSFIEEMWEKHKDVLIDKVFDDAMQEKIVKALNANINIPILNEKTEEGIFNAIYDSIEDVIKNAMKDKL